MTRRVIGAAKSVATVALRGVRCVFEQRKTLNTVERLRTTTNKCKPFAFANLSTNCGLHRTLHAINFFFGVNMKIGNKHCAKCVAYEICRITVSPNGRMCHNFLNAMVKKFTVRPQRAQHRVDICHRCNGDGVILNSQYGRNNGTCDMCKGSGKRSTVA